MRKIFSLIGWIFSKIGKSITFTRNLVFNLFFLLFVFMFVIALQQQKPEPIELENNSVLYLELNGVLVDQPKPIDPFESAVNEILQSDNVVNEITIPDVIYAINRAKNDPAITAIILDLALLRPASLSKLGDITDALADFKTSDKPIYAFADYYSQEQYYIASFADEVLLNPAGGVLIEGYGSYGLYFKEALDKLKLTTHVFRVGTYKTFVEPFIRSDMSAESKEAKLNWLNQLWGEYTKTVANNRAINKVDIAPKAAVFIERLRAANGNVAQYALNSKLVDQLLTREEMQAYLNKKLSEKGSNNARFNRIYFDEYLALQPPLFPDESFIAQDGVGVIFATGQILNGEQPAGSIGGKSLGDLLIQAKNDDRVKSVVLRIDSPGGSAFASEQVRTALLSVKAAGKPVVVSMGSVAASGGYWIASAADEIWAKPTTITGSIGIFGMFATTEKLLSQFGVYSDGVGTTDYAGLSVNRPLPAHMSEIIQMTVDNGYSNFLDVVAEGRNMTPEQVNLVAQGRVWTGQDALERGLVDKLGGLTDAIASAAEKAKVDKSNRILIREPISERDRILSLFTESLIDNVSSQIALDKHGSIATLINTIKTQAAPVLNLTDPQGLYVECFNCNVE